MLLVVDDLEAVKAFFAELGLELEGEATVEGETVGRLIGLDGVKATIASMRTPDGHGRIELDKFHSPAAIRTVPEDAPVCTRWASDASCSRSTTSTTSSRACAATAPRPSARSCSTRTDIGSVTCAGPEGIIIVLAEQLGRPPADLNGRWEGLHGSR